MAVIERGHPDLDVIFNEVDELDTCDACSEEFYTAGIVVYMTDAFALKVCHECAIRIGQHLIKDGMRLAAHQHAQQSALVRQVQNIKG